MGKLFQASHWFNSLHNQDVIVCGLGPSARSIPPATFANHWVIGVNNMPDYTFISPDFLVLIDPYEKYKLEGRWPNIQSTKAKVIFHWEDLPLAHPVMAKIDLHIASHDPIAGMGTPTGIPAWKHTPHVAAALAVRMGAKRVLFVGVDLNDASHPTGGIQAQILDGMRRLLMRCAEADYGCEFFTSSEESALIRVMPFAPLSEFDPKTETGVK